MLFTSPIDQFSHPNRHLIQYVEFGGSFDDLDDDSDVQMPDPNANADGNAKSLEALVHAKNKRLLEELTKLRVSLIHYDPANFASL